MTGSGAPGSPVDAYDRGADAWGAHVDPAYRRFAAALLELAPQTWVGATVVDVAAGSGAVSAALRACGARPVAIDGATRMLRAARVAVRGLPVVAGDALRLPLATASADGAAVGFCINHVSAPHLLLGECARVVRPGGSVLASTFARGPDHPAKELVDAVAVEHGWQPSSWYTEFRDHARHSDTPELLRRCATRAGLTDPVVEEVVVDTGLATPEALVGWRLGMPELAAFSAGLDEGRRADLRRAAIDALGPDPAPLVRLVLLLRGLVPHHAPGRAG